MYFPPVPFISVYIYKKKTPLWCFRHHYTPLLIAAHKFRHFSFCDVCYVLVAVCCNKNVNRLRFPHCCLTPFFGDGRQSDEALSVWVFAVFSLQEMDCNSVISFRQSWPLTVWFLSTLTGKVSDTLDSYTVSGSSLLKDRQFTVI